jgi:hypothetical protein
VLLGHLHVDFIDSLCSIVEKSRKVDHEENIAYSFVSVSILTIIAPTRQGSLPPYLDMNYVDLKKQ